MLKPHRLAGDLRYGGIVSPLPEKHLKIPFDFCTKSPARTLLVKLQGHALVGAVLRAANQNPMIAGGDHTIIQRIVSARQRGKFLSRTVTHQPGLQCCIYTIFRHDTAELDCKMFDIALSALCADVVSPAGKQPGGHRPPLGSPYGRAVTAQP